MSDPKTEKLRRLLMEAFQRLMEARHILKEANCRRLDGQLGLVQRELVKAMPQEVAA